jgi:TM2 domain-containing membrane protein YozV
MINEAQHMQGLTSHQQMLFMSEYNQRRKSKGVAYLLALLLGGFAAQRFYLGQIGYAFAIIAFNTFFWVVWLFGAAVTGSVAGHSDGAAGAMVIFWALTLFLVPGVWIWQLVILGRDVDKHNDRVATETAIMARSVSAPPPPPSSSVVLP